MNNRMEAKEFGRHLIATEDLDPVYVAIAGTRMQPALRARLCLAYWCLYHLGAAAKIAEAKNFWETLRAAAENRKLEWPRGAERRHWRGDNARRSFASLRERFVDAQRLVSCLNRGTFWEVSEHAQTIVGFGPWMAFKIADMLERCLGCPVDFSTCELGIYREPKQGAALYWKQNAGASMSKEQIGKAVEQLRKEIGEDVLAPPDYARPINVQEIETVLCKWKSHYNGRYEVGKDIKELRHALSGWGDLAEELKKNAPKEVL